MTTNLEGYIEVGERIKRFYAKYPKGSLQAFEPPRLEHIGEKTYVVYCAAAYRTPDDARPGIGYAWELVPGPTPFTRDSELQNAETSAWGRAIAALGFETQNGVATREDVERSRAAAGRVAAASPAPPPERGPDEVDADEPIGTRSKPYRRLRAITRDLGELAPAPAPFADWWSSLVADVERVYDRDVSELSERDAGQVAAAMQGILDSWRAKARKQEAEE